MEKLQVKLDEGAHMPTRSHADDAGLDLYAPSGTRSFDLRGTDSTVIDTGVHMLIPRGYAGLVCPRSGLNIREGVLPGIGVIDAGYTGTIKVRLYNHCPDFNTWLTIEPGDRIAQLLILPIWYVEPVLVDELSETERGADGFGSSGR